jgi:hypothetical protein
MGTSKLMILVPLLYLTFLNGDSPQLVQEGQIGGTRLRQDAQPPDATISSYGVPRQSAITGVIKAWRGQDPQKRGTNPLPVAFPQGELRHNSQLLGKGTALYGCRGEGPKRLR